MITPMLLIFILTAVNLKVHSALPVQRYSSILNYLTRKAYHSGSGIAI